MQAHEHREVQQITDILDSLKASRGSLLQLHVVLEYAYDAYEALYITSGFVKNRTYIYLVAMQMISGKMAYMLTLGRVCRVFPLSLQKDEAAHIWPSTPPRMEDISPLATTS